MRTGAVHHHRAGSNQTNLDGGSNGFDDYSMSARGPRWEARSKGLTRYFGRKVCQKHPELNGERLVCNNACVACTKIRAKKYIKAWKKKNRDLINEQRRTPEYRVKNNLRRRTKEARARANAIDRRRRNNDPHYRLSKSLRLRMRLAIKRALVKKTARTFELVGCSVENLIAHIERQFLPSMNWDNYGQWHIDHIRPIALFDLSDPSQQKECFHFSNLQPLWAHTNFRKNSRTIFELNELDRQPPPPQKE